MRKGVPPTVLSFWGPDQNGVVQNDFVCIGRTAKNPALAHEFVNFFLRRAQVIGQVTFTLSYVVVIVRGRLVSIGPEFEEAAADLGAPPRDQLGRVLLPLLAPAIVASAAVGFAISIDDFVVTQYLSSDASTTTVSMLLYANARGAPTPALNAIATVGLAITLLTLLAAFLVYRRFAGGEEATSLATLEV